MKHRTPLALAISALTFGLGAASASGEESSPLRLSMNVSEIAQAAEGTESVASGTTFRFRGFGVFSDASGSAKWGHRVPGLVSDIDLEDVLGMDMETFTGGFLIGLNVGRAHFEASYDGFYDYDGDRVLGSISVDGEVYTGEVKSSLELHAGMLNFGYDLIKADRFTLTGNLGLRIFNVDASIQEVLTGRNSSIELWLPVPTPGLAARVNLTENLYVSGSAAGIWAGDYGSYVELSAEVGYDINRNVGVFIGYRYWTLELDWDNDHLDIDIGGVYAGVEVRI